MDLNNPDHKTRFVSTKVTAEDESKGQSGGLVQPSDVRKRRAEVAAQNSSAQDG
jgi:hypothetical protein